MILPFSDSAVEDVTKETGQESKAEQSKRGRQDPLCVGFEDETGLSLLPQVAESPLRGLGTDKARCAQDGDGSRPGTGCEKEKLGYPGAQPPWTMTPSLPGKDRLRKSAQTQR